MKCKNNNLHLLVAAALGLVLLALRKVLYAVAVDGKNLLAAGHPLSLAIGGIALVCLAVVALAALGSRKSGVVLSCSHPAALGDVLFAAAIAVTMLGMGYPFTTVEKLRLVAGWLCVPALLWIAVSRERGKGVFFGCFTMVSIFFCLYLVSSYQLWSSNPQLQDYVFATLTCVAVALFAYQNGAVVLAMGWAPLWTGAGLLTVAFGLGAIPRSNHSLLYLGAAVWAFTGMLGRKKKEN